MRISEVIGWILTGAMASGIGFMVVIALATIR